MTTQTPEEATAAVTSSRLSGGPHRIGEDATVHDPSSVWQSPAAGPGAYRTDDHRYFMNGEGPVPSVTTVLDILHKPALVAWIGEKSAEIAYGLDRGSLTMDEWKQQVREQRMALRDSAADVGTGVHLLADMATRGSETAPAGFEIPEGWIPYLNAYRDFLGRYSASSIVSSEKMVFGDGYAGTYDFLMLLDDELWLIDIKTSKGYYPETALQLAGYRWAEYIGLPGDPTKYLMPRIDRCGVLHLRPDQYPDTGWRLIEYPVTHRDYVAFLAALELWQWKSEGRFTKSVLNKQKAKA